MVMMIMMMNLVHLNYITFKCNTEYHTAVKTYIQVLYMYIFSMLVNTSK